ncbi:protein of unknown function (plasmid) [Azospirillum baldaniorum]|uniref:Uncharacterized protein n=1 Tax=Azospirillum baldaniorum TaxID=1064539 RepID=A0A9P1NQB0_9PROT|nr:protein of unknown function [Azospirillum baldaniorum]
MSEALIWLSLCQLALITVGTDFSTSRA